MTKTEISWNEFVKVMKKDNPNLHLSEVLKSAGKEWKKIKDGSHDKYIQGKSKPQTRKRKAKAKAGHKKSNSKKHSGKTHDESDDHEEHHSKHNKTHKKHRSKKDLVEIYDKHKKMLDELENLINEMKD